MLLIVTPLITGFSGAHLVGSKNATFSFLIWLRPDAFVAEASDTEYFHATVDQKEILQVFGGVLSKVQ